MNVKELKDLLSQYPDDLEVVVYNPAHQAFEETSFLNSRTLWVDEKKIYGYFTYRSRGRKPVEALEIG